MLWIYTFILGAKAVAGWFQEPNQESVLFAIPEELQSYLEGVPDYDIVYLPPVTPSLNNELVYDLTIFGNTVNLKLHPNEHLVAPNFRAIVRDATEGDRELNGTFSNCHYLHQDDSLAAALSFCGQKQAQGILLLPNDTIEIHPLPNNLHSFLKNKKKNYVPHVIKRTPFLPNSFEDDILEINFPKSKIQRVRRQHGPSKRKYTIESALFFDEAAYKLFGPYFDYKDDQMVDMLLAYMNAIQALYHHPSLKQKIDIVLVKLEIMKKQPLDLPHFNGERNQLLDSFCAFNQKHNPKGDNNPNHWDMGLYVSGLDFFAYENGRKSGVTMGLATVGGVCMDKYNCVIAELGTTNIFGKPYPSAGFTSVYILAHEMGHNIGMHHDSTGNNCPKEGYIMSPSRGTNGETLWSQCSANVVQSMTWAKCLEDVPPKPPPDLDHTKFENQPGQYWGAKRQCEILLRDKDAELYNFSRLEEICENLQCKTPHRSGFYFAGPALEGTNCGANKWCQGGFCVPKKQKNPTNVVKGGWSDWMPSQECSSACLQKSRGYQPRRRTCTNPKPVNTDEGCEGPGYEVITCKDDKICKSKRRSIVEYATIKCQQFSKLLPDLDKNASGLQAAYESGRLWMSCAIFCKRKNYNSYYTPRFDLNDLNVDPYFPDGTWCHNEGGMNYYCLQHHCLPENFRITKGVFISDDVPIPQNAQPKIHPLSDEILKYFSIDLNKKPLLTTLKPDIKHPTDDDWIDNDYIEIPEFRKEVLVTMTVVNIPKYVNADVKKKLGFETVAKMSFFWGVPYPLPQWYWNLSRYRKSFWKVYCHFGDFVMTLLFFSNLFELFLNYHDIRVFVTCTGSIVYIICFRIKIIIYSSQAKILEGVIGSLHKITESLDNNPVKNHQFFEIYLQYFKHAVFFGKGKIIIIAWSVSLLGIYEIIHGNYQETRASRKLPMPGWFPYDSYQSKNFELTCFFQLLSYLSFLLKDVVLDLLFLTILLIINSHLIHLRTLLGQIAEADEKSMRTIHPPDKMHLLTWWIKHHQMVLKAIDDFKKITNPYLFYKYISVGIILFLGGVLITSKSEYDPVQQLIVFSINFSNLLQLYAFSIVGDNITENGLKLTELAPNPNIIRNNKNVRISYLYLATKCSKPILIHFGVINPLSVASFGKIVKVTFSYFITIVQIRNKDIKNEKSMMFFNSTQA